MTIFSAFWRYLGEYQTRLFRLLHITIAIFVILQILNSNGMHFTPENQIGSGLFTLLFTWVHISIGILLFVLTFVLVIYALTQRGLHYFFPYLWGDFDQIKRDIKALLTFSLPETQPKGLACCIQGLGIGAMILVVVSGLTWFYFWQTGSSWAPDARSIHKTLTGLVEAYLIGHGGMALLHFIFWARDNKMKNH